MRHDMIDPARPPEFLFLGDSHVAALQAGASLLGVRADGLSFSGAAWHDARFAFSRTGFEPRNAPAVRLQFEALRSRLGTIDVFSSGPPVISTIGYHLGRLVPPFGWSGHRAFQPGDSENLAADIVSASFLEDYVRHFRQAHFRLARRLHGRAELVVVAPPPAFIRPNYTPFRNVITGMLRDFGIKVFDPAEELVEDTGILAPSYLAEDGIHGTAAYGAAVLTAMHKRGLITLPAPH